MMHQYYDSDEKKYSNRFSYIVLMISCIALICVMLITSLCNRSDDENYVNYEVVIWEDHNVTLYNVNDRSDSICLRLENPYVLVDEKMIQVKY